MRAEPNFILNGTFEKLRIALTDTDRDVVEIEQAIFEEFLGAYEGYDIIEVICREAAVLTARQNIIGEKNSDWESHRRHYQALICKTAQKYAASTDWPSIETKRADAFSQYVEIL